MTVKKTPNQWPMHYAFVCKKENSAKGGGGQLPRPLPKKWSLNTTVAGSTWARV